MFSIPDVGYLAERQLFEIIFSESGKRIDSHVKFPHARIYAVNKFYNQTINNNTKVLTDATNCRTRFSSTTPQSKYTLRNETADGDVNSYAETFQINPLCFRYGSSSLSVPIDYDNCA